MTRASLRPGAAIARALAGFLLALGIWFAFSKPYERALASIDEVLLRATESPAVTRLEARDGEILIERPDFPPAAPRPGLPAADLHFNFALLVALFALDRRPWRPDRVGALLLGLALLCLVHVAALAVQVRSVYANDLGDWSVARYGAFARHSWAALFHFYQIAGRFAAPFAIWWPLRREPEEGTPERNSRRRRRKTVDGRASR